MLLWLDQSIIQGRSIEGYGGVFMLAIELGIL